MTPELRFMAVALLGIAYFAVELSFRTSASGYTREWRSAKRFPVLAALDRFAQMLNLAARPWMLLLIALLLSLVVLLVTLELAPGAIVVAVIAAIVFFLALQRLIEGYCEWQTQRFEEQLVDSIDVMTAALVAGASPLKALEAAARWSEGRTKRELQEVLRRLELGLDIEQALDRIINVYDSEGARLFAQALRAKWQIGGDLAEILTATNRIVRERNKMRIQAAGQLSGIRNASLFVACMPHVMYVLLLILQRPWIASIHADPVGQRLLYAALALQVLGFLWLSRILKFQG